MVGGAIGGDPEKTVRSNNGGTVDAASGLRGSADIGSEHGDDGINDGGGW